VTPDKPAAPEGRQAQQLTGNPAECASFRPIRHFAGAFTERWKATAEKSHSPFLGNATVNTKRLRYFSQFIIGPASEGRHERASCSPCPLTSRFHEFLPKNRPVAQDTLQPRARLETGIPKQRLPAFSNALEHRWLNILARYDTPAAREWCARHPFKSNAKRIPAPHPT
jgi:hypothetical protein